MKHSVVKYKVKTKSEENLFLNFCKSLSLPSTHPFIPLTTIHYMCVYFLQPLLCVV